MEPSSPEFEIEKISEEPQPQTPTTETTNKIPRRGFMGWMAEKAALIGLLGTSAGFLQASDKISRPESRVVPLETKVKTENGWNVNASEYKLTTDNAYSKEPARFQGKVFDITTRQFIDSPTPNSILLSNTDVFVNKGDFRLRNMLASPELLLENPVFLEILERTEEIRTLLEKRVGGQFSEFHLPQAVSTAITEILKFDTKTARQRPFTNLANRISDRATDCQEFTAITAYVLACHGITSDVIGYSWTSSDGERASHICNIININGTCCVVDTTYSNEILTLPDYLKKHPGSPLENNEVFFDSVFPDHPLPWSNPKWIGKENNLIKQGSGFVTNMIDLIGKQKTAKATTNETTPIRNDID